MEHVARVLCPYCESCLLVRLAYVRLQCLVFTLSVLGYTCTDCIMKLILAHKLTRESLRTIINAKHASQECGNKHYWPHRSSCLFKILATALTALRTSFNFRASLLLTSLARALHSTTSVSSRRGKALTCAVRCAHEMRYVRGQEQRESRQSMRLPGCNLLPSLRRA